VTSPAVEEAQFKPSMQTPHSGVKTLIALLVLTGVALAVHVHHLGVEDASI